ncbi:uncharacterized protein LOC133840067 [Drosophila sulfurigaster albostrigata]|uniref:uncharacterized protein LOC133840067 n=1 Tax=Drosophila sulfurigaster albostrigata TaxID=89887 RepID=UPI002D21A10C|nr:uncharacterized protein LOC133840067 [Drosophila sulfurigaster albostrigata]
MASRVVLLLILGLSLGRGDKLSSGTNISKVLPKLKNSDLKKLECALLSTTIEGSPLNLDSITNAILNDDFEQNIGLILELGNAVRVPELKHAIYEILWKECKRYYALYEPRYILEYYEKQSNNPPDYKELVYQKFIADSSSYATSALNVGRDSTDCSKVAEELLFLSQISPNYMNDVFEAVFNKELAKTSPLSLAERLKELGKYNASLSQLATINIQLLNRTEIQSNSSAQAAVLENLQHLAIHPDFVEEVEYSLRLKLYGFLPSGIGLLYTAQKVCLHKANNNNDYLYECQGPTNMCTRERNYERASFEVQRKQIDAKNRTQFAFLSTHFLNHSLAIEQTEVTRNLYGRDQIDLWHVKQVQEGVALHDAATSDSLICGGNSTLWNKENHFAYTLEAKDFDAHREECTWIVEDCSNKQ